MSGEDHVAKGGGLGAVLDDRGPEFTVAAWRRRNLALHAELAARGLIDPAVLPAAAHRHLTENLVSVRVRAATNPRNAGHVRAQNENVLHFGLAARVPRACLTVALAAGFVHDLNKALGEPLRADAFAAHDGAGRRLAAMTTTAQVVALNHLGERTRRALEAATRIGPGALSPEAAAAIDRVIVHHGLGSSRFIRELLDGRNPWWGEEFVDRETGARRIVHPPQPPTTLASVVHDLADSTQQMQGGAAWVMKYPLGYWRAEGRSFAAMLGGAAGGTPMSLAAQLEEEAATCRGMIAAARSEGLADAATAEALEAALRAAMAPSLAWIDEDPARLADPDGGSVYHDVARALGVAPVEARRRLAAAVPGTPEGDALEEALWTSGLGVDEARARALVARIDAAAPLP
jgi:hypothetical protein